MQIIFNFITRQVFHFEMNFANRATQFCFFGSRNGWLMSWKLKVIDIKWDFWHTFITMCWTVRRYNIFSLTRSILQWSAKDHFMHGWVCSILYTSDESEPEWLDPGLELKDFQFGLARDLFLFSSKSKIGQKRAKKFFFWFFN